MACGPEYLAAYVQLECGTILAEVREDRLLSIRGAITVPVKVLLLFAVAAAVTGCANDTGNLPLSLNSASASFLGGPLPAAVQEADLKRAAQQTVSAKMLAAIALERVTGRTPDPSRFSELR